MGFTVENLQSNIAEYKFPAAYVKLCHFRCYNDDEKGDFCQIVYDVYSSLEARTNGDRWYDKRKKTVEWNLDNGFPTTNQVFALMKEEFEPLVCTDVLE